MIPIKSNEICKGLEGALFICPKCGKKLKNVTEKNTIRCTACGNLAIMDKYGFLQPHSKEDVTFRYPYVWYNYQKKIIKKEIENGTVYINHDVILKLFNHDKKTMEEAGYGKLILTNNEFYYEGTEYGKTIKKVFDLEHMVQTPFSPHSHIEIPDSEKFYQFVPVKEENKVIEWTIVIEVLNDIRENNVNY